MTETQKRIKEYKKALPHMKERVTAVALLLAISVAMMTSATFAWMTLSRSPEASSITTTVTTNGNLEIALSGENGAEPPETAVGDGNGEVTDTNLKWGNLINLSSDNYKLSDITLRPASLDTTKLATSPIYSTIYGTDGRVEDYIADFAYTSYDKTEKKYMWYQTMRYGVRAVSSVTYTPSDDADTLYMANQMDLIDRTYKEAGSMFQTLYQNIDYMEVVYRLVQAYANYTLEGTKEDISGDMKVIMDMMDDFVDVVEKLGEAYAEMANVAYCKDQGSISQYERHYKLEHVIANTIPERHVSFLTYYSAYRTLYSETVKAYTGLKKAADKADQNLAVYWTDIASPANVLCDMSEARINGMTISEMNAKVNALDFEFASEVMGWNRETAVIHKGIMKDLDKFLNGEFFVDSKPETDEVLKIRVEVEKGPFSVDRTLHPYVYTAAYHTGDYYGALDYAATEKKASGGNSLKGTPTAAENYAMALDLWVRTNEDDSLLILEGDIITETRTVKGEDSEGNAVDTYIYTYTDAEENEQKLVVYKLTEDGTDTWYVTQTHTPLADVVGTVTITEQNPVLNTEEVPIGYSGVNRVWDELDDPNNAAVMLPPGTTSTTQGSGSCYIFYPESVEDQTQARRLLSAIRIAFIEGDKLLARAYLDTDSSIEVGGRVIVPMKLQANKEINLGNGKTEEFYITQMNKNEARRITAMIYLEGNGLKNEDVLAAGSITGQMNIQFGTNKMELEPMDYDDLKKDYYSITKIAPAGTAEKPYTFVENQDWVVDVKMLIEGIEPSKVTANFMSVINATQGARQPVFELKKNAESGYYEANVKFTMPGTYQLTSLQIDGVDYALSEANSVYVKVPGMGVGTLNWGSDEGVVGNKKTKLTADLQSKELVQLTLGSDDNRVHEVQGVFLGDNGKNVTVNFKNTNGANYEGEATFSNSGIYTLSYLYIDGALTPIDSELYKVMDIKLGLTAEVRLSSPVVVGAESDDERDRILSKLNFTAGVGYSFVYTGEKELTFDVVCLIKDDAGNLIEGKEDVTLYYGQGTTTQALRTNLDWNGKEYVGQLPLDRYGIFNFSSVWLGATDFITRATSAHSITSIPADPMEYVGNSLPAANDNLRFGLGMSREFTIDLANASAATLELLLEHTDGNGVVKTYTLGEYDDSTKMGYVTSTNGNITTFTVKLNADGVWKLVGAKAKTVFYNDFFYEGAVDEQGNKDEETWLNLFELMKAVNANTSVKFVTEATAQLVVEGAEDGVFDLGTKAIGETFNLSAAMKLKVIFKAYDGKNIVEYIPAGQKLTAKLENNLSYKHNNNTVAATNGSPSVVALKGDEKTLGDDSALPLTFDDFTVDGIWKCSDTITVVLNGKEYPVPNTLPSIKVTWTKPKVTITAVSTNVSTDRYYLSSTPSSLNVLTGSYNNRIDEYNAVVYMYVAAQTGSLDQEQVRIKYPTVNLKMENVTTHSGATITFAGSTPIKFAAGSTTSTDNKIGAGTDGVFDEGVLGLGSRVDTWPVFQPAGKQTVSQITVTYNGQDYIVPLARAVTINNPQYPPYVDFVDISSIDPEFNQTTPSRIYSSDGSTITLPGSMTWQGKRETGDTSALVGDVSSLEPTSTNTYKYAYRYKTSGMASYYRHWKTYTVTEKVYEAQTSGTTWTVTNTITGWMDGTNTYGLNEKIAVSGHLTLRPIIKTESNGDEKIVKTTMIRYVVTQADIVKDSDDVKIGNWSDSPPSNYNATSGAPTTYDTGWEVKKG